jgi:hypothetical protein
MRWEVTQNKRGNGTAEINCAIIAKDMAWSRANNAKEFESEFTKRVASEIPKTNSYDPTFSFKVKVIDQNALEIWKMKADGDENYKMFTIKKA